ncbi:exopolyphosphatase [Novosphingobium sp.]|uniref:Ppx/GppA phosphatase family protein n=1 Tax=Novosphingobium sp. TaxID=1874826 RepID=UPI002735655A|nr:exopolyphosphatase [Novosphingobium sp.]MDP3906412.1 exopolyphosphatase [Novosphingobium sp.]
MPPSPDRSAAAAAPRAVIDIGSNTVRLVIYGGPPRAPVVLHNEKVTARLGRGMAETGRISDKAAAQALAALTRYAALLRLQGITAVDAVATAAVRDASNGPELMDRIRALGLKPRLLSGPEEALASASGVQAAFPGAHGVVADLGGGSLELIHISPDGCEHGASMPLGTLRLTALREAGPAAFGAAVRRELATAGWAGSQAQPLYLVGGSWRALARIAMQRARWPLDDPHGHELTAAAAAELAKSLKLGKLVKGPAGIPTGRLAALPDAAALLEVLLEELAPTRIIFSSWGLREGVLLGGLSRAELREHPLLAGVAAFGEARGSPPALAAKVAEWTAAASGPNPDEPLRLAATMLALASFRAEPNRRVTEAMDWALHKRWIGASAGDRAVLAATALANAGTSELPPVLQQLAPPELLHQAVGWGLAIRLCRKFSLCVPHVLAGSALTRSAQGLHLSVQPDLRPLLTDGVEKHRRNLAAWLGLPCP